MPPTEIGKYKILRELGRGAMGAVYLAEDPFIARRVAIKVMRPQVEEGEERFLQEARTVGSLSHPNIVLLHDFGFAGELPYLVMEHVEGTILDRWLAEPHAAGARLRVLAGLCRAVSYAHSRGVLHRDLKPSNVLVRSDGEAKLLDFGIARVENTRMTATGVVLGTPEYLAPELLGSGSFSPRSDMYALGLVAYELFGGRNPFAADTVAACLRKVLEVAPAPLTADGGASAEVAAEVMRCLAKDPLARPESPERLLAATERALAAGHAPSPGAAMATSPTTRMDTGANRTRSARRVRTLAWIAAGAVLAGIIGLGYRLLAPEARAPAQAGESAGRPAPLSPDAAPPAISTPTPGTSAAAATASVPPPPSRAAAAASTKATTPAMPGVALLPHAGGTTSERRIATPARTPASEQSAPEPAPAESVPAAASTLAAPSETEKKQQGAAGEPAAATTAVVPTAAALPPAAAFSAAAAPAPAASLPAVAPLPATPRLVSIVPKTLRRGAGVTVQLRAERLPEGWSVQFRRGGKNTSQIRVLRSKRTGPGELELSLLPEEDAPIGTYSLVLVDSSGAITNALSFEVDL